MNKHTRLVVSVLFVVIAIMTVGITRFYISASPDSNSSGSSAEIVRRLNMDAGGNRIFENSSGKYGIADSHDRITAAAEWLELSFADGRLCIASQKIGGRILMGCINYEGNISVPFIYKSIIKHRTNSFTFYIAESDFDGSCTIYNENFIPFFMHSWDTTEPNGNDLILTRNSGTYTFTADENKFICKKAVIPGQAGNSSFELNIYSRKILEALNTDELEKITSAAGAYLEYAFSGDISLLTKHTGASLGGFSELFRDEECITRKKLKDITDIYIYSESAGKDGDLLVVSATAEADITYKDASGRYKKLSDEYKAIIKFKVSPSGISMVYGGFTGSAPDYPQETEEPQTTAEQPGE